MKRGILANMDDLSALSQRVDRPPFDAFHETLRQRCALILESAPITEMHWQAAWASGRYNAALTSARASQGRIIDLAIASVLDSNPAYRNRATEELLNLTRWSTWVDPSRSRLPMDLCAAEVSLACAVGLDWLWDHLREEQRTEVLNALRQRAIQAYRNSIDADVWWRTAVNHWNAVINSAVGLTALALEDEFDEAGEVAEEAKQNLQHFFDDLGRDGGWDEGIWYWGYAMRFVLLFAEASARLRDDQSLYHQRGMKDTGLFPIYFSPNGKATSFGDIARLPLYGALYLLDARVGRPELTWWLDRYSENNHDVSTTEWSKAGLSLLFHPEDSSAKPPALQRSKVFQQIGWSALADDWPEPSFYCSVKTGDLAVSHAQHDMNSLQLQVNGEMVLVDVGHPMEEGTAYFSGARGEFYEIQARAHNTIIVAEEDHRPDAQGAVVHIEQKPEYHWLVSDAGVAVGEGRRFLRHVVLYTPPEHPEKQALVVLDEIDLALPERVDQFWHTGGRIELDSAKRAGRIHGRDVVLSMAFASSAELTVSTDVRRLDAHRTDHIVHLHGGLSGRNLLASVFSRQKRPGELTLSTKEDRVTLHRGGLKVVFEPGRKHLALRSVGLEKT